MNNLGGVRVGIAFHNNPLDANPSYTYLTSLAGVSVQRVTTKRGRADERSKISVGTATITGIDTTGVLDPTNTTGAYYGPDGTYGNPLDPVRQAIIEIQNPVTLAWSAIFQGFVGDWTYTLDPSAKFINWQLDLVDALDILDNAEVIPDVAGNTVPQESQGDCYYTGQGADDRILAAIADVATSLFGVIWPATRLHINSGNVWLQGVAYPARTTLLQVIQDACDGEFPGVGIFFVRGDGTLTFHGRYVRFQPQNYQPNGLLIWKAGDTPAFHLDSGKAIIASLEFTRGKTNLINGCLCTPAGLAPSAVAGQLASDPTSISTYAPRVVSFENLVTEGSQIDSNTALQETKEYAQYYVDNFKYPRSRISKVTFRSTDPTRILSGEAAARGTALWQLIAGDGSVRPVDLSDLINITTTHPGGGGFQNVGNFVESVAYTITPLNDKFSNVQVECDLSPQAYYDVAFPP